MRVVAFVIFLSLIFNATFSFPSGKNCEQLPSNAQMRECFEKESIQATAAADALAQRISSCFRRDARKEDAVVAPLLEKAARGVEQSQATWKTYREQHCTAIEDSYTTGSGGGTAFYECELRFARQRLTELRTAFP